ncbi:MAG: hypothetical protein AAGK21_01600 [Bacteroidota bacterium]
MSHASTLRRLAHAPRWWGAVLLAALAAPASAHVKWFSEFSFGDRPLALGEVWTTTAIALLALSVVVVGALVWVDRQLADAAWHTRLDAWLAGYRDRSVLVLRVGAGATLLLAWQGDAIFVPELEVPAAWVGWVQFGLVLLLLSPRTTPAAGAGMLALYAYGFALFSALHMLDYVFFAGVGVFFLVSQAANERTRALGLPALYLTVGFALCWVALEKLVYPEWGLYVLENNPQLALGFPLEFFLTAAAFIEFSLGFLLIICLLQRPLALVITLVFFCTTLVFGKTEVIGHTLIHAALIVFLIEGPGTVYRAPYTFHERPALRTAFASVNLALLFGLMLVPYAALAWTAYEDHTVAVARALVEAEAPLALALDVESDGGDGWVVRVEAESFQFTPASGIHVEGEGHAHLYVDGKKVARMYGPVVHLPGLDPGQRTVTAVLATRDHRLYAHGGEAVLAEQRVTVP